MKESLFLKKFLEIAEKEFCNKNCIIKEKQNLFYELSVDEKMGLSVKDISIPMRGRSAFQTDICIYEKNKENIETPMIVIEFKTKPTTHDVLIYSSKAEKHKRIYPWLRYGMLAESINIIPNRFFINNEHLDFFVAAKDLINKDNINSFIKKLIENELNTSRILKNIYFEKSTFNYYRTTVESNNFEF